ncbi:hypothetical protein DFH06DRAFT_599571 [Mycena polygramma]|nr:hypothetical protein DFH06DRAFT_599571 [Mycena polygramma]
MSGIFAAMVFTSHSAVLILPSVSFADRPPFPFPLSTSSPFLPLLLALPMPLLTGRHAGTQAQSLPSSNSTSQHNRQYLTERPHRLWDVVFVFGRTNEQRANGKKKKDKKETAYAYSPGSSPTSSLLHHQR